MGADWLVSALLGRLLVGVEGDEEETRLADEGDGTVFRAYIDARWQNRYVLVAGEQGREIERAWGAGSMGHTFIRIGDSPVYVDLQKVGYTALDGAYRRAEKHEDGTWWTGIVPRQITLERVPLYPGSKLTQMREVRAGVPSGT